MILALIEHDRGTLEEASLQMLTFGREAAARMDVPLIAVLMGESARPLADTIRAYGVTSLVWIRHTGVEDYAPAAWASAMFQIMEKKQPRIILAAGTDRGNEVMAHLAARADLPMAANCAEIRPGDPFEVIRLRWGSTLLEEAVLHGEPKLVTVAPLVTTPKESPAAREPVLEEFLPELEDADLLVRVIRREEAVTEGISLKTAPVVIGGGRGVGSPEGYSILEELAGLLGGAVGGSRIATNNGWRPHSDQIGLTGSRIAPDLYIACGISGAIQHMVGCKGAKRILVINNDPDAPFFSRADYGVVGDLHEVLPAIIDEIKKFR
ncbi:MAG TPA: electron transfer flavoprotein subunit alpha/FixB family protein [Desulfobacteraceae bacterium]|jgi:electron transfer flavoprotein alpha subunit|nr:electron transfer flavoprotein subunit alpha/FixB family protein [Desulfobacteraceae bacterium]